MKYLKRNILLVIAAAFVLTAAFNPLMAQRPDVGRGIAVPNRPVPPLSQQPAGGTIAGGVKEIAPLGTSSTDSVPGTAPQQAEGEANVLLEMLQPHPAPSFAGLFAQAERIAEGRAACPRRHFAMHFHIASELPVEMAVVQQISDTAEDFAHLAPFTRCARPIG